MIPITPDPDAARTALGPLLSARDDAGALGVSVWCAFVKKSRGPCAGVELAGDGRRCMPGTHIMSPSTDGRIPSLDGLHYLREVEAEAAKGRERITASDDRPAAVRS